MNAFDTPTDYAEIRDGVARVCARFPGPYWRDLDARRAYPGEFVTALSEAGYLSAMIPEEYGGSGLNLSAAAAILDEIHSNGCNAGVRDRRATRSAARRETRRRPARPRGTARRATSRPR